MQIIANEVVNPKMISVQLGDIGGLDHVIEDLVSGDLRCCTTSLTTISQAVHRCS